MEGLPNKQITITNMEGLSKQTWKLYLIRYMEDLPNYNHGSLPKLIKPMEDLPKQTWKVYLNTNIQFNYAQIWKVYLKRHGSITLTQK